ncbi:type II secretion system protein H [compost metagenome]|uniref:Type II secretion system protein H n=1 Tax=Pseudomonas jinjuensis TaxID=198616 RepID=A0A1H0MKY9_9PSED|nr:GspH/FimT family pseudopilin [Pseudomonas jinjuensis]SDO80975.1 type IV fimbrial biogenesis protein FimT [Pseudomonas jinjuensis]
MRRPVKSTGFTLIELMVVIAIVAILASVSAPNFRNLILDNRLSNTTNLMLGMLQLARSEAVMQRTTISVCAANDAKSACADSTNWSNGALLMSGSTVLKVINPVSTEVTITSSASKVEYQPDGTTTAGTISISDARPASRQIKINAIGQACSGSACS